MKLGHRRISASASSKSIRDKEVSYYSTIEVSFSISLSQDLLHPLAGSFIMPGDHVRVTNISLWSSQALKILLSGVNGNSVLQIKEIWPEGIG